MCVLPHPHHFFRFYFPKMFRLVIAALVLIAFAKGQTCESPQFKVVSHSTRDARLAAEPAAQLEITVKCKSGKQVCCFYFILFFNGRYLLLANYTLCRY